MASSGSADACTEVANPAVIVDTASASASEGVVNPHGGPAEATADTGTHISVVLPADNRLGVPHATYSVYLSGWKWAKEDSNIGPNRVGLVVKASGYDFRRPPWEQRPPCDEYGLTSEGCQPLFVCCPIGMEDYRSGFEILMEQCRKVMQQGQSILFHCDTGRTRAPCLLAVWISYVRSSGRLMTRPLWTMGEYIFPSRKVNELYYRLYHENFILGNEKWCPAAYRDYVMVCRIRYETALYHQYKGWVNPPVHPLKTNHIGRHKGIETWSLNSRSPALTTRVEIRMTSVTKE